MTEINLTCECCAGTAATFGQKIELDTPRKQLVLDFLFLDLSVCTR